MKRLAAILLLIFMPQLAYSYPWNVQKDSVLLLSEDNKVGLAIIKISDKVWLPFFIKNSRTDICKNPENSTDFYTKIYAVNGQKIKMIATCMGDAYSLHPETREGTEYIMGQIFNNNNITFISENFIVTFHNNEGDKAIRALIHADDAI